MTPPARSDLPVIEAESRPYWDAAADGRLLIRSCRACGEVHHYPRPFCPACWSDDVEWVEASGAATLYTWSVVRRNDVVPFDQLVPYVPAVVDLAEGPRMMTNVVDIDPDDLTIGMNLMVTFRQQDDTLTVPVFSPAD
jgi:uncharacterized OB-fold protein